MRLGPAILLLTMLSACGQAIRQEAAASAASAADNSSQLLEPEWTAAEIADESAASSTTGQAFASQTRRPGRFIINCVVRSDCVGERGAAQLAALEEAATFLRKLFGEPVVQGQVRVKLSPDVGVGARMIWKPADRAGREVHLGKLSFLPEERKTIVHELFHALYQSDDFLAQQPDLVVEGLAVYAEYRYRYSGSPPPKIASTMLSQLKALGLKAPLEPEAYNLPFGAKSPADRDILYIAAGHFFMSQDDAVLSRNVRGILTAAQKHRWTSLSVFAAQNSLRVNSNVFADAPAFAMPNNIGSTTPSRNAFCGYDPSESPRDDLGEFLREVLDKDKLREWRQRSCDQKVESQTLPAKSSGR